MQLLIGLKAIANIGIASNEFKMELLAIIEDRNINTEIRVAAVEAHRRLPCDDSRSYFEKLFRNNQIDSEVRIAAYLQVMRCPNYVVIRMIQNSLETEEVNQGIVNNTGSSNRIPLNGVWFQWALLFGVICTIY